MNNKYSLPKDGGLIAESTPRDIIHRYEKIHTTVYENEYLGVQYVADTIVKAKSTKSSSPSCWALPRAARRWDSTASW